MPETLGEVDIVVRVVTGDMDASLARARKSAEDFSNASQGHFRKSEAAMEGARAQAELLRFTMDKLKEAMVIGGIGFGVEKIIEVTSAWTDLNSRLKEVTGSVAAGRATMDRLIEVAQRTYTPIERTTEGFLELSESLKGLGVSARTTLDFQEALNDALVVSGAKGGAAAAVQEALTRAMAQGQLRGIQLNTVLNRGSVIAGLLSKALGGDGPQALRRFAAEGKITGDVILNTLVKNLDELRKKADDMPATLYDALVTSMGNAMTIFIGRMYEGVKGTDALAKSIVSLSFAIIAATEPTVNLTNAGLAYMDSVMTDLGLHTAIASTIIRDFFVVVIGSLAVRATLALAEAITGRLIGAVVLLGRAMLLNPFGLFITALVAAGVAVYELSDTIDKVFGVNVKKSMEDFVNIIAKGFMIAVATAKAIMKGFSIDIGGTFAEIGRASAQFLLNAVADVANLAAGKHIADYVDLPPVVSAHTKELAAAMADLNVEIAKILASNPVKTFTDVAGALEKTTKNAESAAGAAEHIKTQTEAYAKAMEKLKFDMATAFFTPEQKAVADVLHSVFNEEWQNHTSDAIVKLTKINFEMQQMKASYDAMKQMTFDNATMFMSQAEKAAADAMHSAFPDNWEQHMHDMTAEMARFNEHLKEAYSMSRDFAGTFVHGILDGKSAVESLGDALKNLENRIIDMALDAVVQGFFRMLVSGGTGGSATSNIFTTLLGMPSAGGVGGTGTTDRQTTYRATGGVMGSTPARLYKGEKLKYDEYPAILHAGERVIPAGGGAPKHGLSGEQMIRMFGGTPHFAGGWESTPSGNYSYSNATGYGPSGETTGTYYSATNPGVAYHYDSGPALHGGSAYPFGGGGGGGGGGRRRAGGGGGGGGSVAGGAVVGGALTPILRLDLPPLSMGSFGGLAGRYRTDDDPLFAPGHETIHTIRPKVHLSPIDTTGKPPGTVPAYHLGGYVGSTPGTLRNLSMSAFIGAPYFAGGYSDYSGYSSGATNYGSTTSNPTYSHTSSSSSYGSTTPGSSSGGYGAGLSSPSYSASYSSNTSASSGFHSYTGSISTPSYSSNTSGSSGYAGLSGLSTTPSTSAYAGLGGNRGFSSAGLFPSSMYSIASGPAALGGAGRFGSDFGDTPTPMIRPGTPNVGLGSRDRQANIQTQTTLAGLGYRVDIDGVIGPQTLAAIRAYERDNARASGVPTRMPGVFGPTDTINARLRREGSLIVIPSETRFNRQALVPGAASGVPIPRRNPWASFVESIPFETTLGRTPLPGELGLGGKVVRTSPVTGTPFNVGAGIMPGGGGVAGSISSGFTPAAVFPDYGRGTFAGGHGAVSTPKLDVTGTIQTGAGFGRTTEAEWRIDTGLGGALTPTGGPDESTGKRPAPPAWRTPAQDAIIRQLYPGAGMPLPPPPIVSGGPHLGFTAAQRADMLLHGSAHVDADGNFVPGPPEVTGHRVDTLSPPPIIIRNPGLPLIGAGGRPNIPTLITPGGVVTTGAEAAARAIGRGAAAFGRAAYSAASAAQDFLTSLPGNLGAGVAHDIRTIQKSPLFDFGPAHPAYSPDDIKTPPAFGPSGSLIRGSQFAAMGRGVPLPRPRPITEAPAVEPSTDDEYFTRHPFDEQIDRNVGKRMGTYMDRVMGGLETGGRLAGEEMATIPTRAGAGFGFGDSQLAKNAIAQMTTWTAASPGLGLNQLRDLPDQFYDSEHRPREQFRPSMTSPAVEQMWRQFDRSRVNYRGEKGDFSDFPVYHGGGVVGSTPVAHRVLSSSLFKHAPRFAGGLAPDEYPAVLHAGETVTPAAGRMRSSSSPTVVVNTPPQQAPNVTVNVINNTGAQVTTNTQEEHGNIKLDIMLDEIVSAKMRDGGSRISRTMSSMGARPQPVRR